jgi:hypothetical protein
VIVLYRAQCAPRADRIEERLQDLAVGYRVEILGNEVADRPVIWDQRRIEGETALARCIEELERFVAEWRKFESDACYLEDDGTVC